MTPTTIMRSATYYPNISNQCWSNTVPGVVDVMGVIFATSVTVNALATYRLPFGRLIEAQAVSLAINDQFCCRR